MRCKSTHKVSPFKTLCQDFVEFHHRFRDFTFEQMLRHHKIIIIVEHIEVVDGGLVGDIPSCERCHLVKDRQRIAHTAISLSSNDIECSFFTLDALLLRHVLKMAHRVAHLHTVKVVNLTARENRGKNLVLLRSSKNENGVCRRFFQRFEKSIESRLRQHMHLVNDKHFVASHLRRNLHLLNEFADVVNGIVGSSIQFVNVVGATFIEGYATFAMITRFSALTRCETVDSFSENACRSGLTHTSRTAEKIGVRQFSCSNRVFKCCGKRTLPHHTIEIGGTIFASRNNVV